MIQAVSLGLLEPLDSFLESRGKDIQSVLKKDYLDTGYIDGIRYGLPSVRDYAASACFEYSVDLADKYGLHMDSVKNLDDLEKELIRLKEEDSSIIPVGINLNIGADTLLKIDSIGDNFSRYLAVLPNCGQNSKVVNLYETQEFSSFVKRMYQWRQKGLLMEETGATMSAINYLKSGKVLGCFSHYHPGFDVEETRGSGTKIDCVVLGENYITSFSTNRLFWVIPAKSQAKEAAMLFLNRMYTDENVVRILSYGKEGTHYEYKDEAKEVIGYPEGVNVDNSRYSQFFGWIYGNEMLMPVWEGLPTDMWNQVTDYNDTAVRSVGMGFCFNPTPVEKEITKCEAVVQKYYTGLINGELDPEKYLPILQRELKGAGIDDVVKEKQKQLDQYLEGESKS